MEWRSIFSRTRLTLLPKSFGEKRAVGQGLVEYALILVFVAVVMVIILTLLGPGISNIYSNIVDVLQGQ